MEERYSFPMGGPLPILSQRVVGVGATARMVHPASGYMVAYTLQSIPAMVETAVRGLRKCSIAEHGLQRVAHDVWVSNWTPDRRRLFVIYSMGADILVGLDARALSAFFVSFFTLPVEQWEGFLFRSNTTRGLVIAMLRMFFIAPMKIRTALVKGALFSGNGRVKLLGAVVCGVAQGDASDNQAARMRHICGSVLSAVAVVLLSSFALMILASYAQIMASGAADI
eukprot:SAG31_NODE_9881_length_1216_cov_2.523724_1_plen_225_part_00